VKEKSIQGGKPEGSWKKWSRRIAVGDSNKKNDVNENTKLKKPLKRGSRSKIRREPMACSRRDCLDIKGEKLYLGKRRPRKEGGNDSFDLFCPIRTPKKGESDYVSLKKQLETRKKSASGNLNWRKGGGKRSRERKSPPYTKEGGSERKRKGKKK